MKKKILLKESELVKLINLVLEDEQDLDLYDDWDYYDAFLNVFKNWVKTNIPEKEQTYPTSFLIKKYSKKFLQDLVPEASSEYEDYDEINTYRGNIKTLIRHFIDKNLYKFPTLQKTEKFTEKYRKGLEYIVKNMDIPKWVSLEFTEEKPQYVYVKIKTDYPSMLQDNSSERFHKGNFEDKLEKYFENYLGVELGNPIYGQLSMKFERPEYINLGTWIKDVLDKKLKKEIRALDNRKMIRSLKFTPKDNYGEIKVTWKSEAPWSGRAEMKQKIKDYLTSQGYPDNRLQIESY